MSKRYCLTNYAVQCTDINSGTIGCFIFDPEYWVKHGLFKALTPVYPGLSEFFLEHRDQCSPIYIEREA